jgi:hypothetical protein
MVDENGSPTWGEGDFFREWFYIDYMYEVWPKD